VLDRADGVSLHRPRMRAAPPGGRDRSRRRVLRGEDGRRPRRAGGAARMAVPGRARAASPEHGARAHGALPDRRRTGETAAARGREALDHAPAANEGGLAGGYNPCVLYRFDRVRKSYGPREVLRDVTWQHNPGEKVGLVGRNGAGKTTLLRLVLGREEPDAGEVIRASAVRISTVEQELTTELDETLHDSATG